jgi:hypothetical protein
MASGPQQTRQIGSALRIYKNADDRVIGMDDISVVASTRNLGTTFHRSSSFRSQRCYFHVGTVDRDVALVQMFGDYDDITYDGGDYLTATWNGTDDSNDSVMLFSGLAKLGDTI